MDSYREHPSDFDLGSASEAQHSSEPPNASEVAAAIGTDERRMHVRAYNYWVSLLDGRDFPSIEDLEPGDVEDFAEHSVLLDFTCGRDNPAIPYIGAGIRDECGLSDDARTIDDVPSRSLLSRLTDHYLQIIANRAPIGFEAEFVNQREETICYRGILMPFSSDGDTIDFIYGVINWKHVGAAAEAETEAGPEADALPAAEPVPFQLEPEPEASAEDLLELVDMVAPDAAPQEAEASTDDSLELTDMVAPEAVPEEQATEAGFAEVDPVDEVENAPEPVAEPDAAPEPAAVAEPEAQPVPHFSWEDGPLHDEDSDAIPEVALPADAGLADRLWAARETAEAVTAGEARSRAALYKALSLAYDFAIAAQLNPQDYAELLEESGVKAQARAPMTPIVKLVFGIDYDKARLTEFAAALSYATRQDIALGDFEDFIAKQPGGLKALVAAERQARRPAPRPDTKGELARASLRTAPPISLAEVPAEEEFAVVVTRRGADGQHEVVAIVEDEKLVERAIRQVAH